MRLLSLIETIRLYEAAKDRYAQMFASLKPYMDKADEGGWNSTNEFVEKEIVWAMQTMRKADKVTWYLRWVKLAVLARLYSTFKEKPELLAPIQAAYQKAHGQMEAKTGASEQDVSITRNTMFGGGDYKRKMEHFMSLGLPALENYVFAWQRPEQIWADWTPIEAAWQKQAKQIMDIDREGVDTLIKYPDGSEWVNLNRHACEKEAAAMGHCGNTATPHEGDTVLSYRTIEKTDKGEMWKPRLTFILNTRTGLLGEMKGRANQKPDSKYHGVILDLLRLPEVKGIGSGGYEPENNFKLEDLPEDVSEKLIDEKPGLASISYDYKKRGITQELLSRIEAEFENIGEDMPEYNPGKKHFSFALRYDNAKEFIEQLGGDHAEWVMKVLSGDEYLDDWGGGDDYWAEKIYDELPLNITTAIGQFLQENYAHIVEEWKEEQDEDFDPSKRVYVWDIVKDHGVEEVMTALRRAAEDAMRYGAEGQMSKYLERWLVDMDNEEDIPLELSSHEWWDDKKGLYMNVPEDAFIDIVSNQMDDLEYHSGDIDSMAKIKPMEGPYQGYDEVDEAAGVEAAIEHLHEEGVLK